MYFIFASSQYINAGRIINELYLTLSPNDKNMHNKKSAAVLFSLLKWINEKVIPANDKMRGMSEMIAVVPSVISGLKMNKNIHTIIVK